jgi:hypothetical protein
MKKKSLQIKTDKKIENKNKMLRKVKSLKNYVNHIKLMAIIKIYKLYKKNKMGFLRSYL